MKKQTKTVLKTHQTSYQTDIEDSYPYYTAKNRTNAPIKRKRFQGHYKKHAPVNFPKKILRFHLSNLRRTLRVPAYKEESLNLPIRFTKKLNAMEVDNDLDTDEEVVEHGIEKCCNWLKEAIRANNQELTKKKECQ